MVKRARPAWVEIDLDAFEENFRKIKALVRPGTMVTGVIKADAYGHGAVEIGKVLLDQGVDRFAVATLSEAVQLRKVFKSVPILILGYTPTYGADELIENEIIQTMYNVDEARIFSARAEKLGKTLKVHIKIDSGMSRLGFQATEDSVDKIMEISKLPYIEIEGMFTHFAVADEIDKAYTYGQYEKYKFMVDALKARGLEIPVKHVSNSAAIMDLPEMNLDMVRAGIILYGLYPSNEVIKDRIDLKQVMSLKAEISHVKELEAGRGVSYGLKYVTPGLRKIATIPIGYADGFTRMLSGKAEVLVKGKKVPVVGRICMDQCLIDVTGIDVKIGDEVVLFGSDGKNTISIDEVAAKLGTINYEITCMINKRIPREYTRDGKTVKTVDYLMYL
ncbi:MAG: alanine racemase [Peptostreptococcaceae bacterium]|nr:alanine racemase [Peptostreptococcaceae bacterium]